MATVAAFGVLKLVADARQREDYDGLNGLAKTNPLLAFCLTVSMLSLAGIPLTGGFFGKFFVFSAAVENGYIGLVVFAVVMSMVSIYYYLRPIIAMYMRDTDADTGRGRARYHLPVGRPAAAGFADGAAGRTARSGSRRAVRRPLLQFRLRQRPCRSGGGVLRFGPFVYYRPDSDTAIGAYAKRM